MYTGILAKIPVLIAVVLLLVALAKIYFRFKNINYAEFTRIIKKFRYFDVRIIVYTLIITVIFGIFNHLDMRKSVHAVISLNYSEASQALNSNGTRFNMAEIICDEVVEKAIKKGAFEDVTVKQLKDCLSVHPSVQGDVGDESEYHISTEFLIEYHASKHTAHLDSENVIKLITAAYKEYYIEKYTDNFMLETLGEKPVFEELEYMDIVSVFNKETTAILNYLYGMAGKNSSFVTTNNTTFNSIAGKVHQFQETQIKQNLQALILQNGIVRNREGYLDRLSYQNKNTDFDRERNFVSFDLCNQAIARYSEEMTRIVLVPTWDQSGKYYMGRTKVGIDELSVKATEFSNNVASNEKLIMDNNLITEKMSGELPDESMYAAADELVASIYKSIKDFEREAINAGREYSNYKMNQCISVSIYGASLIDELKILIMFAALAYAAFVLSGISGKLPKRA